MTTKSEYETKSSGGSASSSTIGAGSTETSKPAAVGGVVSDAAETVREEAANVKDVATTRIPEVTATTRLPSGDCSRATRATGRTTPPSSCRAASATCGCRGASSMPT